MKRSILLLGLLWLTVLISYSVFRYHTFVGHLAHDDGLFLYGGQAWAGGDLPFQDFWDHKAPGIFFYHSIPLRLFPFSLTAVKSFQIICLSVGAIGLFVLCHRYFSMTASLLTLASFVFYTSMRYTVRSGGLTEESALLFIVLYLVMLLRKLPLSLKAVFIAGVCLGIAIQFRQTFAVAVCVALWVIARAFPPRRNFSETVRYAGVLLAGILVPECLISLYFLVHGIWRDYFEASYGFNFFYIGQGRPSRPWADILNWHWKFIQATGPYLFSPLLVLAVWRWVTKDARWLFWPLLLVFCGDMISASLSGEFYEHYYVQTAVTVSLLLALFFDGIVSLFKQTFHAGLIKVKSIAAMGYVLLLCAVCLIPFYSAAQRFAADSRSVLEAQESDSSATAMQRSVADAIKQLTAPGDRILLLGRDPNSVYFLSGRYAGARYYHFAPLWKDKFVRCITPHHIEFFINDLTEKQPVLLLVDLRPQRGRDEQGLERWALYIPEITPYIETNYLSLEAVLDEIPEDDWFWYDNWLSILVRSDKADEVKQRFSSQ